jgi:hypothetical protein
MCCLVYSPTGPGQRVMSLAYPTGTLLGPGRLPPAGTTEWGLLPPSGPTIQWHVTEPPPYRSALGLSRSQRASDGGSRGRRLRVVTHDTSDPRHVAAAVQRYLYNSDGHCAARAEDMADRARNGQLPESNRVCGICFGDLERIVVTREAASIGNGSFHISNQRINRGPLLRQR